MLKCDFSEAGATFRFHAILGCLSSLQIFSYALGSFTLHFGLKYEIIYQLDAIEYLFVFFQLDMFQAYTPIFTSNGCYSFFTYAAYVKKL